jgi:hypothetical protein
MTIDAQQPGSSAPAWYLDRFEGLAEVLARSGLRTRLVTSPGRLPSLHVVNPAASALAEDVYLGRSRDGVWWFWWPWAERIATRDDLEGAAIMIKRVLAAHE